jgi:hypothetical protein
MTHFKPTPQLVVRELVKLLGLLPLLRFTVTLPCDMLGDHLSTSEGSGSACCSTGLTAQGILHFCSLRGRCPSQGRGLIILLSPFRGFDSARGTTRSARRVCRLACSACFTWTASPRIYRATGSRYLDPASMASPSVPLGTLMVAHLLCTSPDWLSHRSGGSEGSCIDDGVERFVARVPKTSSSSHVLDCLLEDLLENKACRKARRSRALCAAAEEPLGWCLALVQRLDEV